MKYLRLFAEQLKLDKESESECFYFAALIILINDHLSPHVDAMNLQEDNDYTMAFSMIIPLKEIYVASGGEGADRQKRGE